MTAPRDPIEAPQDAIRELIRVSKSAGMNAASDFGYLPSQQQADEQEISEAVQSVYAAIEAAARDEGRQEAVRLLEALRDEQRYAGALSDALLRMGHHPFAHHEAPTQYDADSARACSFQQCLDDVARHGRSSDPEPAPNPDDHDGRLIEQAITIIEAAGKAAFILPYWSRRADAWLDRARRRGAVPALQATPEPARHACCSGCNDEGHCTHGLPATAPEVAPDPAHYRPEFPNECGWIGVYGWLDNIPAAGPCTLADDHEGPHERHPTRAALQATGNPDIDIIEAAFDDADRAGATGEGERHE